MKTIKREQSTLLTNLLLGGQITREGNEYVGWAADGKQVNLGYVEYEAELERYLKEYPTPDTW